MSTVVVGDIGGHESVFRSIREVLGIGEDLKIPPGLQVIQVGDLVRADSAFRVSNTKIMRLVRDILHANPDDAWIQLLGNHECAALGGPSKPDWAANDAFDQECVSIIQDLWRTKRIRLAHHDGGTLITHAGLTHDRWQRLGQPGTPKSAAEAINRDMGKPMSQFAAPGRLVTGCTLLDADTMWAEVNRELLTPWIAAGTAPFAQIHGHASPFNWAAKEWWKDTPSEVADATRVDESIRRSLTTLPDGSALCSVDWNLEKNPPQTLWPLLELTHDYSATTLENSPALWKGPGVLFSVSKSGRSESFTDLRGPRARVALWEKRWQSPGTSYLPSVHALTSGSPNIAADFAKSNTCQSFSFELDVSWNNDSEKTQCFEYMKRVLPQQIFNYIYALPRLDPSSINENRGVYGEIKDPGIKAAILDLPINSVPSTRRRTRPLVTGVRWVRLILLEHGLIALWYPMEEKSWPPARVPWPHNAVPSRTRDYLTCLREGHVTPQERRSQWLNDTMKHELYHNDTWLAEIEHWQDDTFRWLTGTLTTADVQTLRSDLGMLSTFATSTRWTQRALARRAKESAVGRFYPQAQRDLIKTATVLENSISQMRQRLNESFDILSTVSQRVQEEAASQAKEASERLNWLVTLFTAILIVPTVVSGVYGANIDVLADGAKGSLTELIALMVGLALFSYGILSIVPKRRTDCILGISCGLATILIYELAIRVLTLAPSIALSILPLIIFAISTTFMRIKSGGNNA